MKKTKIEWCDSTWNPVTGCFNGCKYCYARRIATRFGRTEQKELHYLERRFCDEETGKNLAYPFGFDPTMHEYRLGDPKNWNDPKNIFVCSMADLFGPWIPKGWIKEVFDACKDAPQHNYLFLTKFPDRYTELANAGELPRESNFWYGSTITSMKEKLWDGSIYFNTFASIEPLLEPLDVGIGSFGSTDWLIIGAETGYRSNKVVPEKEWVDKICKAAALTQIPVFMKDSMLPIVGRKNWRTEFPKELKHSEFTDDIIDAPIIIEAEE